MKSFTPDEYRHEVLRLKVVACSNPGVGEKESEETLLGYATSLPEAHQIGESHHLLFIGENPEEPNPRYERWFVENNPVGSEGYVIHDADPKRPERKKVSSRIIVSSGRSEAVRPDPPLKEVPGYYDWQQRW